MTWTGAAASAQTQTQPPTTRPAPAPNTTRVSAASATVHARCDESSPVRIMLSRGESVVIQSFQENWVQVRVPATGEEGCMRRSVLERIPAMDQADAARRSRQTATGPSARPAPAPRLDRGMISVNATYQAASATFSDEQTFPLYQETASYTSHYEVKSNVAFDAGGAVRLWRNLGVAVAVSRFEDSRDITIDGTLPHPFFFQRERPINGTAPGTREELATHVDAAYFLTVSPKISIVAFGGASMFNVKQSVVTELKYTETFPYDTVAFAPPTVTVEKETKVGFNVGVDVGFYFTKNIGVGGIVRFARATIPFSVGDLDVGGASAGGGVRVRF